MNKKKTSLIIGVVLLGALLLLYSPYVHKYDKGTDPAKIIRVQEVDYTKTQKDPLTDVQGSVTVKVTPVELSSDALEWKFDVELNTHAVELNQDMTKISVIFDEQGNEYKPLRWEGPTTGGHHVEGTLVFKSILPRPKKITLKIIGLDAPLRSFVWEITN